MTRDFITALAAGEQGTAEQRRAACDSLSIIANDQLLAVGRKLGASDCPQTLARIGTAAGPDQYAKARSTPIDVAITGDVATASYAAPLDGELTTIKLRPIGETWIIQELPTSGSASGSSGGAATTTAPTEADAPSGDLGPVAAYIPQDVLKYCKAITGADLPEGVTAALNCKPFTDTEINYGIVKDRATLDRLCRNAGTAAPREPPRAPSPGPPARSRAATRAGSRTERSGSRTAGFGAGRQSPASPVPVVRGRQPGCADLHHGGHRATGLGLALPRVGRDAGPTSVSRESDRGAWRYGSTGSGAGQARGTS